MPLLRNVRPHSPQSIRLNASKHQGVALLIPTLLCKVPRDWLHEVNAVPSRYVSTFHHWNCSKDFYETWQWWSTLKVGLARNLDCQFKNPCLKCGKKNYKVSETENIQQKKSYTGQTVRPFKVCNCCLECFSMWYTFREKRKKVMNLYQRRATYLHIWISELFKKRNFRFLRRLLRRWPPSGLLRRADW